MSKSVLKKLVDGEAPLDLNSRDREILGVIRKVLHEGFGPKRVCAEILALLPSLRGEERSLVRELVYGCSDDVRPNTMNKSAWWVKLAARVAFAGVAVPAFAGDPLNNVAPDLSAHGSSSHVESPTPVTPIGKFGPFNVSPNGIDFSTSLGDMGIRANAGTNLSPSADDTKSSITPGFNNASVIAESKDGKLRVGTEVSLGTEASYGAYISMLYARAGTRISVKGNDEVKHFFITQGFQIDENDTIVITGSILRRIEKIAFPEINQARESEMSQKGIGFDYTHNNPDQKSALAALSLLVNYFRLGDVDYGRMGALVTDNGQFFDQFGFYGGLRGGARIAAEVNTAFRFGDGSLRFDIAPGLAHTSRDAMYDAPATSDVSLTGAAKLTYQFGDDKNRFELGVRGSDVGVNYQTGYTRSLGEGFEMFVQGGYNDRNGGEDETRIFAGLRWTFGGGDLDPLFAEPNKSQTLTHEALMPRGAMASDQFQINPEKVTGTRHEIGINWSVLSGDSFLEKNPDGTLKAINLDTGVNNLVSVSSVNYPEHASYFSIADGKYLRIINFGNLHAPAEYRFSVLDSDGTYTIMSFTTSKNSVNLDTALGEPVHKLSKGVADDYVAGRISVDEAKASLNNAPTAINLSSSTIAENSANNTDVATLTATDPNAGDTHTFSLVSQTIAGAFKVVGNKLQVNDSTKLDFETNPTIDVTLRATDAGGLTKDQAFTITISDVNEAPPNEAPTAINLSSSTIAENSANNTDVATLTATDPNAGDTHTFSLVSQTIAGAFKVVGNKLQVNDSTKLDFETNPTIDVTIRATDSGGLTRDEVKTITVSDVNEAFTANNFTFGVDIGNAAKTVSWSDRSGAGASNPEGTGELSASITANGAHGTFTIAGLNVTYTPTEANYIGSDTATIKIIDAVTPGHDQIKTITVENINMDNTAPSIDNVNFGPRQVKESTAGEYIEATVTDASGLSAAWDVAANYEVTVDDGFGTSFILDSSKYTVTRVADDRVRFTITDPTAIPNWAGGTVDVRSKVGALTDTSPSANAVAGGTRIFFTSIVN